jgi:DNA-3-methyladenine glycosylase I
MDKNNGLSRCGWSSKEDLYIGYHDMEWGVPVYDDMKIFEFLLLESFQAGLSWLTILKKRENFRKAFDGFNPDLISKYDEDDVARLMLDSGIIRNQMKIKATINNARRFLETQKEFGSFNNYIWGFTGYKTIKNHWAGLSEIPPRTELSNKISSDMKKRGFRFVGSTVIYAHMQATGMVNDHLVSCFRYNQVAG